MINSTTHISENGRWCYKVTNETRTYCKIPMPCKVVYFFDDYCNVWRPSIMAPTRLIDLSKFRNQLTDN